MDIQVLGAHNCESLTTRCTSLLIDDVLAIDAGGLTASLDFEAQLRLKALLLTHQHYDHVRDVPFLAMNFFLRGDTIDMYGTRPLYEAIASHLLDGKLYPEFLKTPQPSPTINFNIVEPYQEWEVAGYHITAVPVNHPVATTGYQVAAPDGKKVFYTGDTGPGLFHGWHHVSPQAVFVELTAPDRDIEHSRELGHLTPALLQQEMVEFRAARGYLPQVYLVHINPALEMEIASEIAAVARSLDTPIALAYEGMRIHL